MCSSSLFSVPLPDGLARPLRHPHHGALPAPGHRHLPPQPPRHRQGGHLTPYSNHLFGDLNNHSNAAIITKRPEESLEYHNYPSNTVIITQI